MGWWKDNKIKPAVTIARKPHSFDAVSPALLLFPVPGLHSLTLFSSLPFPHSPSEGWVLGSLPPSCLYGCVSRAPPLKESTFPLSPSLWPEDTVFLIERFIAAKWLSINPSGRAKPASQRQSALLIEHWMACFKLWCQAGSEEIAITAIRSSWTSYSTSY